MQKHKDGPLFSVSHRNATDRHQAIGKFKHDADVYWTDADKELEDSDFGISVEQGVANAQAVMLRELADFIETTGLPLDEQQFSFRHSAPYTIMSGVDDDERDRLRAEDRLRYLRNLHEVLKVHDVEHRKVNTNFYLGWEIPLNALGSIYQVESKQGVCRTEPVFDENGEPVMEEVEKLVTEKVIEQKTNRVCPPLIADTDLPTP